MSDLIQRLTAAAALYEDAVLGRHTELRLAHENSESKLVELKEHLRSRPPAEDLGIGVLAVAGSLARREASSLSDIDLIVTTVAEPEEASTSAIVAWRTKLCEERGSEHDPRRASVRRDYGRDDPR